MSTTVICLEVRGVPLTLNDHKDTLDQEWYHAFHGVTVPLRWITLTEPFDMSEAVRALQATKAPLLRVIEAFNPVYKILQQGGIPDEGAFFAALPDDLKTRFETILDRSRIDDRTYWRDLLGDIAQMYPLWRVELLNEYIAWYRSLEQTPGVLRRVRHFCLAWCSPGDARSIERDLMSRIQRHLQTSVWKSTLPTMFAGAYYLEDNHLVPQEPHHQYAKTISTYEFRGTWSVGDYWEQLFSLAIPRLGLALTIMPNPWSELKTTAVANSALNKEDDHMQGKGARDARNQERANVALEIEQLLQTGRQSLHRVQAHVLFFGDTVEQLDQITKDIQDSLRTGAYFIDPKSMQSNAAQLFSPQPPENIKLGPTHQPYTMLSQQLANLIPLGLSSPEGRTGVLWGMDRHSTAPIFFDPFTGKDGQKTPAHAIILGKTGTGKTFMTNHILRRAVLNGWNCIFIEPQSHSRRLVNSLNYNGDMAAHRYAITEHDTLNPLDIVVYRDDEGRYPRLAEQVDHVIGRLSTLLGTDTTGKERQTFRPKEWTTQEDVILSQALTRLYTPYTDRLLDLTATETPLISDLVEEIKYIQQAYQSGDGVIQSDEMSQTAKMLTILIEAKLIQQLGYVVNKPTSIQWDFEEYALLAYGLDGLRSPRLKTYFFDHIFGAINRYIRDPNRDNTQPILVVFDEFAYSIRNVPALKQFVALAAKTWRTRRAALLTIDQNPHEYVGVTDDQADPDLKSMWENLAIRFVFRLDKEPAQRLRDKLPYLTSDHQAMITTAGVGDYLIIWDKDAQDDVTRTEIWNAHMESNPLERAFFEGS